MNGCSILNPAPGSPTAADSKPEVHAEGGKRSSKPCGVRVVPRDHAYRWPEYSDNFGTAPQAQRAMAA